jgi:hypothetical protein
MHALGLSTFSQIWYRNLEQYVAKHHSLGARITVKVLITVGMLLRVIVSTIRADRHGVSAYASVLRGSLTGWRP